MSFIDYYEQCKKNFDFRIKTVNRLGDEEMDIIEMVLEKYRPAKIGKPTKTMFQTEPLGFTGVKNTEVWIVDVTLTVPAHSPTLRYDLNTAFGLAGNSPMIVVCGDEDPTADQEEMLSREHDEALLLDPEYKEADEVDSDELFGDVYNSNFLEVIKKVEADRAYKQKIDAPHPITKWAQQPADPSQEEPKFDSTNFNDQLKKKK